MTLDIVWKGKVIATLQPGDSLDVDGEEDAYLVYYTKDEAVHMRGLLKLRQEAMQRTITFVENRVRKELSPG